MNRLCPKWAQLCPTATEDLKNIVYSPAALRRVTALFLPPKVAAAYAAQHSGMLQRLTRQQRNETWLRTNGVMGYHRTYYDNDDPPLSQQLSVAMKLPRPPQRQSDNDENYRDGDERTRGRHHLHKQQQQQQQRKPGWVRDTRTNVGYLNRSQTQRLPSGMTVGGRHLGGPRPLSSGSSSSLSSTTSFAVRPHMPAPLDTVSLSSPKRRVVDVLAQGLDKALRHIYGTACDSLVQDISWRTWRLTLKEVATEEKRRRREGDWHAVEDDWNMPEMEDEGGSRNEGSGDNSGGGVGGGSGFSIAYVAPPNRRRYDHDGYDGDEDDEGGDQTEEDEEGTARYEDGGEGSGRYRGENSNDQINSGGGNRHGEKRGGNGGRSQRDYYDEVQDVIASDGEYDDDRDGYRMDEDEDDDRRGDGADDEADDGDEEHDDDDDRNWHDDESPNEYDPRLAETQLAQNNNNNPNNKQNQDGEGASAPSDPTQPSNEDKGEQNGKDGDGTGKENPDGLPPELRLKVALDTIAKGVQECWDLSGHPRGAGENEEKGDKKNDENSKPKSEKKVVPQPRKRIWWKAVNGRYNPPQIPPLAASYIYPPFTENQ